MSDFEFRLPRPSYTADTLAALRQAYPDRLFTLVIGADNWLAFKDWKKPDEILSHHRILVYPRPGYAVETASLPPGVKLTDTPLIDISSTELRRLISQGDDASYGLDEAVWQEIRKKGEGAINGLLLQAFDFSRHVTSLRHPSLTKADMPTHSLYQFYLQYRCYVIRLLLRQHHFQAVFATSELHLSVT